MRALVTLEAHGELGLEALGAVGGLLAGERLVNLVRIRRHLFDLILVVLMAPSVVVSVWEVHIEAAQKDYYI